MSDFWTQLWNIYPHFTQTLDSTFEKKVGLGTFNLSQKVNSICRFKTKNSYKSLKSRKQTSWCINLEGHFWYCINSEQIHLLFIKILYFQQHKNSFTESLLGLLTQLFNFLMTLFGLLTQLWNVLSNSDLDSRLNFEF